VKKIVEELGGFMYVESEYGKGSKFSFTLPYNHLDLRKDESLDVYKESVHDWKDRKILVVEDVDSNYFFIKTVIERTKAQISWAKNGKQAVDICNYFVPDLILMDIQLPELNGYDASRLIREKYPEIPIIAQSACVFAGEKEKMLESGCNEYISKPIKPKVLLETINKYFS
jgi:CheY-like chemotaxis protein